MTKRRAATVTTAARPTVLVDGAIAALLAAAVLALYAQTAHFDFVTLDDPAFIVENPPVLQGLTWDGVVWAFTEAYSPNWHPVTWLSHMLDCSLFGLQAGPQHVVSALIHALNASLLFLTLLYMTGARWPSALAAALFAVHPMRAESVAWLSERKDVLSGLFWILTMLAYAWYARRPLLRRYLIVAVALALGLMSKTMLVSLPFVLLLLDLWPLARWRLPGAPAAPAARAPVPPVSLGWLIAEKLPLLALSALASWITIYTQQTVRAIRTTDEISLPWRIANALISYVSYLWKSLWPSDLAGLYPHPALNGTPFAAVRWPAVGAALLLILATVLCLSQARRRPYLSVGWLWFLVALVPVIGLMQVGMQGMADRYMYLPGLGICLMVAWGGRDVVARWPQNRALGAAAATLALAAYAAVSWVHIGTWRDSRTLFERAIAATRDNYLAHANLGAWLSQQGRIKEAARHLEEALRIRRQEPYTLMQYGTLLQDQGKLDDAARYHEEALRLSPGYAQALANLGVVRLRQDRFVEAAAHFEAALRRKPIYPFAEMNLGVALLKQRRFDEATVHLQRAVALDPRSAEAHNNFGVLLAQQGNLREAAEQFETALRLKPRHASAVRNLKWVRKQLGSNN